MDNNTTFEDRILDRLVDYQNEEVNAGGTTATKPKRRVASAGIGVVALAAAVAAFVVFTPSQTNIPMKAASAVRSTGSNMILHVTQPLPNGKTDIWTDETLPSSTRSVDSDAAGHVTGSTQERVTNGKDESVGVDYDKRQWSTNSYASGPDTPDANAPQIGAFNPRGIVDAYEQHQLKSKGTESLNGRSVLRLEEKVPNDGNHLAKSRTWWIDADTYLPVQMTMISVIDNSSETFTYEWIDRTPDSLHATLWPDVPAGFTQVS